MAEEGQEGWVKYAPAKSYGTIAAPSEVATTETLSKAPSKDVLQESSSLLDDDYVCKGITKKRRRYIFGCVGGSMFLDQLVYTILMPLLPTLKATNNMSDFLVGFMVSCYGIGLLISGPLAAKYMGRLSYTKVILLSLILLSGSSFLFMFGTLNGDNPSANIALFIVARLVSGLGAGCGMAGGYSMIASLYPSNELGVIMGSVEAFTALGMLLGPSLGGVLAQFSAPFVPFVVSGIMCVIFFVLDYKILVEPDRKAAISNSWVHLLRQTGVPLVMSILIMVLTLLSFVLPQLPGLLHSTFGQPPGVIATVLLTNSIFFAASSPIVGWLSDRFSREVVIIVGIVITTVSMFAMTLVERFGLEYLFASTLGIGSGAALIPIHPELAEIVRRMGNDDYLSIYAMSIVAVAIAETLGPMVGGAFVQGFQGAVVKRPDGTLDEQLKYQYAFLTYGIITVVCAAAATFFAHRVMKTKKMMRERDNDGSELVQRL